jgi:hypothetical protein
MQISETIIELKSILKTCFIVKTNNSIEYVFILFFFNSNKGRTKARTMKRGYYYYRLKL